MKPRLALTFDTEWWGRANLLTGVEKHRGLARDVEKVLDLIELLERHNSKATFFVVSEDFKGEVLDTLIENGLRDDYIVLVGGAPLNEEFGEAIGADAYCRDAAVAAETATALVSKRRSAA